MRVRRQGMKNGTCDPVGAPVTFIVLARPTWSSAHVREDGLGGVSGAELGWRYPNGCRQPCFYTLNICFCLRFFIR